MKKLLLFLLLNFLFLQSQDLKWHLEPNHSESSAASHTITDDNNNVYFSGNFIGAIGFKKNGTYQLTGTNKNRPFVSKLDQNGNHVWSRKIEGDQININSLNIDSAGNLIITGTADGSTIDLNTDDPGEEIITSSNANNLRGTFILKLDQTGNYIWGNFYHETWSEGYSEIDKQNNILTFGQFTAATDFDASSAGNYQINVPQVSNFIMKTDPSGALIWVKYFTNFWKLGMKVDDAGNIICAGNFSSQLNFNGENDFNLPSSYDNKTFLIKLDSNGNFKWYQGLINEFRANNVNQTLETYSNGDIVILADFQNTNTITFPNKSATITGGFALSSFLLNLDKDGNYLNHSVIKSSDNLYSYNLMLDSKENQRIFVQPNNKFVNIVTALGVTEQTKLIAKNNSIYLKFSRDGKLIYHKSGLFTRYNTTFAIDTADDMYFPGYLINSGKIDVNPSQDASLIIQSGFFNSKSYLQKLSGCYTQVPDGDTNVTACATQNLKLSDLFPKTSYTKWYTSATGAISIPSSTVIQNGVAYYASVPDSSCPTNPTRLEVVASVSTNLPKLVVADFTFCNPQSYKLLDLNIDQSRGPLKFFDSNGNLIPDTTFVIADELYYVTYSAGGCDSEKAPFKVFNQSPIPSGLASQTFCKSSNSTINDLNVNGQNLTFYDANGVVINSQTILQHQQFYYVTQTVNSCVSLKLKIQVTLLETSAPNVNNVQNFCIQDHATISDIEIRGTSVKWYDVAGTLLNTNTPLVDGTRYFATQTLSGCESARKEILVTVNDPNPPTGNATQDFCSAQNPTISNIILIEQNVKWYDAIGTLLPPTTPLVDGKTYYATQTVNGCESTQKIAITVSITNGGIQAKDFSKAFCNDTTANTKADNLNNYKGNLITNPANYTFEFSDANNQVVQNPSNINLNIGANLFTVKVSNSLGCFVFVKLTLTLNPKPILNLPTDVEFCNGQSATLNAGNGFSSYEWRKDNSATVISTDQILVISEAGKYFLKVKNSFGCENSASVNVTQSVIATIVGIQIVNNTATVQMSTAGDFEYSLDNIKWQDSNVFKNRENGSYTVFVRTKLGCIIGSMNFSIFSISNVFTPNADGSNDTWKISGLENYPGSQIQVFDRFGDVVFQSITNGSFEWNGYSNSRVLPTGNYWYVVKVSDGRLLNGWVLIKNRN